MAAITRLSPNKHLEPPPDWDEAIQFLSRHGLASIAAYNLQYRMPLADVPPDVRDFLLGYMQGTVTDNLLKLMTLRQIASRFGERPFVLLDAVAFVDTLYPHLSFRGVPEIRLLVRAGDRDAIVAALAEENFVEMEGEEPDPDRPAATLYNDRFYLKLFVRLLPRGGEEGLFARAVPAITYGPSSLRLQAEDALLVHVVSLARRAFRVPRIYFVDLREMVRGESSVLIGPGGPGSPIDAEVVLARARALGVTNALWAAMQILAEYHPEVAERAQALSPPIPAALRTLLRRAVVKMADRERVVRGAERVLRLLFE